MRSYNSKITVTMQRLQSNRMRNHTVTGTSNIVDGLIKVRHFTFIEAVVFGTQTKAIRGSLSPYCLLFLQI